MVELSPVDLGYVKARGALAARRLRSAVLSTSTGDYGAALEAWWTAHSVLTLLSEHMSLGLKT